MNATSERAKREFEYFKSKIDQEALIERVLSHSLCTINYEDIKYLDKILGNEYEISRAPIYRGSKHKWKLSDFEKRCLEKGPTLSLFKVKDGPCIGGFTTANWGNPLYFSSIFSSSKCDNSAFLFNLTDKRCFKIISSDPAIHCDRYKAADFGENELAVEEPFNGENKCKSVAGEKVFNIKKDAEGRNMLTNQKGDEFTITEYEVYTVTRKL
jgi:hypothetical protein